jgi:pyruvate/2-oxoglutarate dehydrogenase complex dihydrolipoamide acyltransferase (E2) component
VLPSFCSLNDALSHRDDTVEVGAKLYEIDSEGVASTGMTATASPTAPATTSKPAEDVNETTTATKSDGTTSSSSSSHRTPSIQFLGKSGWQAIKTPGQQSTKKAPQHAAVVQVAAKKPLAITVIYDETIDCNYGRPKFSAAEIEAVMTGGATLAPNVVSISSGASFSP